jgi:hypothetical protein
MKTKLKQLLTFSVAATLLCFYSCSCGDKGICDLVINGMKTVFSKETTNSKIFNIACDVANQIYEGICKCEKLGEAGSNNFQGNVYYTPDSIAPSDWGAPAATDNFRQGALAGCATDQRHLDVEFLQDGIYQVESIIDQLSEVKEQNEDNNTQYLNGRAIHDNNNIQKNNKSTLQIRITGIGKSKLMDPNGKPIMARILSIH